MRRGHLLFLESLLVATCDRGGEIGPQGLPGSEITKNHFGWRIVVKCRVQVFGKIELLSR